MNKKFTFQAVNFIGDVLFETTVVAPNEVRAKEAFVVQANIYTKQAFNARLVSVDETEPVPEVKKELSFKELHEQRQKYGETNDCTVKALCRVARISYDEAHQYAKESGRKARKGWYSEILLDYVSRQYGLNFKRIKTERMNVRRFIQEHPVGRFYLNMRGHAFNVIDGKLIGQVSDRVFVTNVWEFVE